LSNILQIVDLATLTGACVIALGTSMAGTQLKNPAEKLNLCVVFESKIGS